MQKRLNLSACKVKLLAGCLLLLFYQQAQAEWYKDYEAGMEALKKGQNQAAVGRLQSAISQKVDEGTSIKFYGMKFDDYFPHYYLGMAYFNSKNYDAALREFQISERNGAIQKRHELYAKLGNFKSLARAQHVVKEEPKIASNPPPPPPVKKEPEVKEEDKQTQSEVKTTQTENPKPAEPEPTEVTELKTQPREVKPTTKEEKPPAVQETKVTPPAEISPPAPDVNLESSKIIVKNGARKYFDGDFDGAISMLNSALELNPKDASAYFLLGCSYASKYLLSGSQDKALLQSASAAFSNSRKVNPAFRVRNKTYFSPAVLDLYTKSS